MDQVEALPGFVILDRASWADKPPTGLLDIEAPEDVRFLLVHHTASANDYTEDEVAPTLRGFFDFHTSAEKGWPDIAYNFLVDRFGRVWEARQGSIQLPVKGSATGGSQGFALLCAFIGDHMSVAPTAEATGAMATLLGWLATTYDIDIAQGATVDFVSRGSNRWPTGSNVTARTISGHREMSQTTCPGDKGFAAIDAEIVPMANQVVARLQTSQTTEPPATTTTSAAAPTTSSATEPPPTQAVISASSETPVNVVVAQPKSLPTSWLVPAAAIAALAGAIQIRRRRI